VPLDYSSPTGPSIAIALARRPALVPSQRIGSLVINPGGPGDSGIDDLPNELRVLTGGLQDDFDIVSFDPRGVERSDPVHCVQGTGSAPGPLPDPAPTTSSGQQDLIAGFRAYAQDCLARTPSALLGHVGTVDTARDLDRIRAALGDARLTFMGHSYGTLLGATYAEMFPTHVRAMVLDGAIDPALSLQQMAQDQAVGFDSSLNAFLNWCAGSSSCAWHPGGDPRSAFLSLADQLRRQRIPAGGGRTVGVGELYLATMDTLTATSFWPTLGRALAEASQGNGSGVLSLSDRYQVHGSTNSSDANSAINCEDHPGNTDLSSYPSTADAAARRAPVFGPVFEWATAICGVWPVPASRIVGPAKDPGAPPILVVGTTADPATPYQWARNLAGELNQGVLVSRQGVDHVAYFYSSCVRSIDEAYLLRLTLPSNDTMCAN
jgi:pimeloyl-ACP methyl ester carboxylesterase